LGTAVSVSTTFTTAAAFCLLGILVALRAVNVSPTDAAERAHRIETVQVGPVENGTAAPEDVQ
jgi:hypothetical protein